MSECTNPRIDIRARIIRSYTTCTRWGAGPMDAKGRVRYGVCVVHGGRSRTASVDLRFDRCDIARRKLPVAR